MLQTIQHSKVMKQIPEEGEKSCLKIRPLEKSE